MSEYDRKVNLVFSLCFWVPFVLWLVGITDLIVIKTFNLAVIGFLLLPFAELFTKGGYE